MFFGRQHELKRLNQLWQEMRMQMIVVYGRRRVGKTALIKEFAKDKPTIWFTGMEASRETNLEHLSAAVLGDGMGVFYDFTRLLERIALRASEERLLVVLDEYPYLAKAMPEVSSQLQIYLDHHFPQTQLFLVLCGSSMSFMEKQVLGYQSPLYGRRTAQFKVQPFDYWDTARCFSHWSPTAQAEAYAVTGGGPLCVNELRPYPDLRAALLARLFNPNAMLYEEPGNLLKQELREPQTYNTILGAIATGASKINEIATASHLESGACSKYLQNLEALGLVRKETPLEAHSVRKSIYLLADSFFRFWYYFVPRNWNRIQADRMAEVYDVAVTAKMPQFMGLTFEQMCKEYLTYHCEELPMPIAQLGQWWGTDSQRRREVQLDIVGLSPDNREVLFAECKYRNAPVDVDVLDELLANVGAYPLKPNTQCHCMLFSKSGFTQGLVQRAAREGVRLITLEEMLA